MEIINQYSEPSFTGFGDTLNLVSFENYLFDNEVEIIYHYNDLQKSYVTYLCENFFIPNNKIKRSFTDFKLNKNKIYQLTNHDYWPSKITNEKIYDVAISFYHVKKLSSQKHHRKFLEDDTYDTILNLCINKNYVIIGNEYNFDTTKKDIINISKSKLFIGSDGGMAHIARSLKIPSILFFRDGSLMYEKIVKPYIDTNLQTLCTSEKQLIYNIERVI